MHPLLIGINAKYIHTNTAVRLLWANTSHRTDTLEYTIKDDPDAIISEICKHRPLYVGFSVYIWNVELIQSIVTTLKATTEIPIVLGGPEVSYDAMHFLKSWGVDVVIKGEGEQSMDALFDYFNGECTQYALPNASTLSHDAPINEIDDLDALASPHFLEETNPPSTRIVYVESSRGCPYKCSYCLSSLEKSVRFFSINRVLKEIDYQLKRGVKTIKFLDRTFNANPDAPHIIDYIIDAHTPGSVFQFEMTGDTISNALVQQIHARAPKGLFRFEIGIQSTHTKTNLLVGRHQNNAKLFNTIKTILDKGIITLHLDLIAGLPQEDLTRFKQTFNEVFALGASELQLGFLKMLRGTRIREDAARFAYTYDSKAPYEITSNDVLSATDLTRIKNVESMLEIFHNKGYFNDTLFTLIMAYSSDAFDFFEQLYTAYTHKNMPFRGYQLDALYGFISAFLQSLGFAQHAIDTLKWDFLGHFKIKPKPYFEKISDKALRRSILTTLHNRETINLQTLYKHTLIAPYKGDYLVALYSGTHSTLYRIKKNWLAT